MDFETEVSVNFYDSVIDSDSRNFCKESLTEKSQRDSYFNRSNTEEYAYGDQRWK